MNSELHDTLNKIMTIECDPPIFKVFISASDHQEGFHAWVDFRGDRIDSISARGRTPELTINTLHKILVKKFSKCVHCGRSGG